MSPTSLPEPDVADAVVAAVLAVPGVVEMHPGTFGEVATYLPGRRVRGVQIRPDSAQVHVVFRWGIDIAETAARVRLAVEPIVGVPVDVTVQDLALDDLRPPPPSTSDRSLA